VPTSGVGFNTRHRLAVSLAALLAVASAAAYGFSRPRLSTDRLGFEATMVVLGGLLLLSYWAIQNPDDFSSSGRIGEDLGIEPKLDFQPEQPGDVPITFADVEKAGRLLGYAPKVPIREGVRRFVEWYRGKES